MVDQQLFTLNNSYSYQYYVLKIANNWGNTSNMGFRQIQFFQSIAYIYVLLPIVMYFILSDPLSSLPTITPPNNNDIQWIIL